MIVARVRTPVPLEGLVGVLHDAAHAALGQCPGARDVVAYAQLVEEHGVDESGLYLRGVYGRNLGNIDATALELADPAIAVFDTFQEHEGAGLHVWSARHVRRAYATLEDAAAGYWTALTARFLGAYEAMIDDTGEPAPEAFAAHLAAERYYTGSAEACARALERIVAQVTRG